MKETINLIDNTETFTSDVIGAGNFYPLLDFSNVIAGQEIEVRQYVDVIGENDPKIINGGIVTLDILQASGDEAGVFMPYPLEDNQIGRVSLTLIAGATPLAVPYRVTDLQTFV